MGAYACCPDRRVTRNDRSIIELDRVGGHTGDLGAESHVDSHQLEPPLCLVAELRCERSEQPILTFDEDNLRKVDVELGEVPPQNPMEQFGEAAGHFDSRRTSTGDHDRGRCPLLCRVGAARRPLEVPEDVIADVHGLGGTLQPEGMLGDAVHAEVGGDGSEGKHEEVVRQRFAHFGVDETALEVDVDDTALHRSGVLLTMEDATGCVTDVVGIEPRGCHLIEQRLKRVVVPLVDDGHIDVGVAQRSCRFDSAEAGTDNHDKGTFGHGPTVPAGPTQTVA